MVVDRHFVESFDQFFELFGVDRVRVQGDAVEVALDPRHLVELFEEFVADGIPRLAPAVGSPKRPVRSTLAPGSARLITGAESFSSLA